MAKQELDESELIPALLAAYPHLRVRPLREYYPAGHYMELSTGAWIGGEDVGVYMALSIKEAEDYLKSHPAWPDKKPGWIAHVTGKSPSFDLPF